jgi:hypothetical protein
MVGNEAVEESAVEKCSVAGRIDGGAVVGGAVAKEYRYRLNAVGIVECLNILRFLTEVWIDDSNVVYEEGACCCWCCRLSTRRLQLLVSLATFDSSS